MANTGLTNIDVMPQVPTLPTNIGGVGNPTGAANASNIGQATGIPTGGSDSITINPFDPKFGGTGLPIPTTGTTVQTGSDAITTNPVDPKFPSPTVPTPILTPGTDAITTNPVDQKITNPASSGLPTPNSGLQINTNPDGTSTVGTTNTGVVTSPIPTASGIGTPTIDPSTGLPTDPTNFPANGLGPTGATPPQNLDLGQLLGLDSASNPNLGKQLDSIFGAGFGQAYAKLLAAGGGFNPSINAALINQLKPQETRAFDNIRQALSNAGLSPSGSAFSLASGDFWSQAANNENAIIAGNFNNALDREYGLFGQGLDAARLNEANKASLFDNLNNILSLLSKLGIGSGGGGGGKGGGSGSGSGIQIPGLPNIFHRNPPTANPGASGDPALDAYLASLRGDGPPDISGVDVGSGTTLDDIFALFGSTPGVTFGPDGNSSFSANPGQYFNAAGQTIDLQSPTVPNELDLQYVNQDGTGSDFISDNTGYGGPDIFGTDDWGD